MTNKVTNKNKFLNIPMKQFKVRWIIFLFFVLVLILFAAIWFAIEFLTNNNALITQSTKHHRMGQQPSKMAAPVVVNATAKHTATVIFLHGLGDTGHGWASALAGIGSPHVKYVCPTAAVMPVTLNAGFKMPSWFDLKSLDVDGDEDVNGIKKARDTIHQMIEQEVKEGIPHNRILLGGFSQGGALALYSLFTNKQTLAGTVALSCWLPLRSEFPGAVLGNAAAPILQCHGVSDPVVPFKFGELTSQLLRQFVPNLEFKSYHDLFHSSNDMEMKDVKLFIDRCLPPV